MLGVEDRIDVAEFLSSGRVEVDFEAGDLPNRIARGFEQFLKGKSLEDRMQWAFDLGVVDEHGNSDYDTGYARKSGGPYDRKDIFHYKIILDALLKERKIETGRHEPWLRDLQELFSLSFMKILEFARSFDADSPGLDLSRRILDPAAMAMHALRALHYDQRGRDETDSAQIGKPHTDKNFLTLHVAESAPGMRMGDNHELYRAAPHTALIFTGDKMGRLSEGKIPALLHDVRSDGMTQGSRWSIVFFCHIAV